MRPTGEFPPVHQHGEIRRNWQEYRGVVHPEGRRGAKDVGQPWRRCSPGTRMRGAIMVWYRTKHPGLPQYRDGGSERQERIHSRFLAVVDVDGGDRKENGSHYRHISLTDGTGDHIDDRNGERTEESRHEPEHGLTATRGRPYVEQPIIERR